MRLTKLERQPNGASFERVDAGTVVDLWPG